VRIRNSVELPDPLADRVEAAQERLVRPRQDQPAVLDAGRADDTSRLERALDLVEGFERSVDRLQDGMTQAGVELVVVHFQRVHVAGTKVDVVDPLSRRIAPRLPEGVLIGIDANHVSGDLCQTNRDGAVAAADIKDAEGRR
jgi:hypothetical protein